MSTSPMPLNLQLLPVESKQHQAWRPLLNPVTGLLCPARLGNGKCNTAGKSSNEHLIKNDSSDFFDQNHFI